MTRTLLALGLLLTSLAASAAQTYYVSTTGSDANPGTLARPFLTLQKGVDTAQPGDSVLLRTGVYSVNKATRVVGKPGSAAAPILISGEDGAVLRASGEGVPGVWGGLIEISRSSYITVRNIAVENSSFFGFKVVDSSVITIDASRSTVSLGSGVYAGNVAAFTLTGSDLSRFCDRNQFGASPTVGCQEGVSLVGVNGFTVKGNKVHDAYQSVGVKSGGGEGIDAKQGTKNGIIAFNQVWNLVQLGIYVDAYSMDVSNIAIYGNRVWNTYLGVVVSSEAGATASDIKINDNIIYDVGSDGILVSNFGQDGSRRRVAIFNNTIVNAGIAEAKPPWTEAVDFGTGINVATANVTGLEIFDNIVAGSKTSPMRIKAALRVASIVQTNLQWPAPSGKAPDEYAGLGAIFAEPGFVAPLSKDWHLTATSPAMGAGTGSALFLLDADNILRPNGPIDLGALAFRR